MKYTILFLTCLTCANLVFSQSSTNQYTADLDKLYAVLQQTPSYKAQVKGEAQVRYRQLYDSLRKLDSSQFSSWDYFTSLSKLFFPIRDNHLGFYELFDNAHFADTASYRKFRTALEQQDYLTVSLNTDSLRKILLTKPETEVEGIYHYDKYYAFGLYKSGTNEYTGVILNSEIPHWKKGQVIARLYEYAPGNFRAIYAGPLTKKLNFYPNEKFRNGELVNSSFYVAPSQSVYKKRPESVDFVNIGKTDSDFELKTLRPDVQYLRLGNFSAFPKMMVISDQFYASVKDSLSAKNLVVDLRNNTGGAEKVSKKFLQMIKNYARQGNVYVLVNNGTISQGEIFLLQLKTIKNVTSYGQTTQGKIAYGSNYGNRVKLPSGRYEIYITDMKDKNGLVKYENIGVTPDVMFDNSEDWINRLLTRIGNTH